MKLRRELFIILSLSTVVCAQQVGVDADGRSGSAILRQKGTGCYAITVNHVVQGAVEIKLLDGQDRHADAFLKREYTDADLAILEVEPPNQTICDQANWPVKTAGITNVIQDAGALGTLVRIAAGGSGIAQIPVSIGNINNGQIIVSSQSQQTIAKGWSGSGLYVAGNRLVGILKSVDTSTGQGNVSSIDSVERIVSEFFNPDVISDTFIREVISSDFNDRLHSIFALFVANELETLRGNYVSSDQGPQDSSGTRTFNSTVQLPAFDQPGTLDFHNYSGYYKPIHLGKHPLNLVYTQSFRDQVPTAKVLKERFDALVGVVDSVVPRSWARNSYSDGYSRGEPYKYRSEYASDGMRIIIDLNSFDLKVQFLPKE